MRPPRNAPLSLLSGDRFEVRVYTYVDSRYSVCTQGFVSGPQTLFALRCAYLRSKEDALNGVLAATLLPAPPCRRVVAAR
eukprot:7415396-Pyramimonas_sp.AAC.1